MNHLDLFSGVGGFSLAFDNTFYEQKNTHTFVEIDPFCQEVLRKHWPEAEIVSDIRSFANSGIKEQRGLSGIGGKEMAETWKSGVFMLTGGFPCQPFSQAGRRKGTEDDRHLWPEMLRVIRFTKPQWVIAENVRGILTIEGGMVFEQVCFDLEGEGYDVQPIVIPAVAVNAPHRRDRVWFIAHSRSAGRWENPGSALGDESANERRSAKDDNIIGGKDEDNHASDTSNSGLEGRRKAGEGYGGQLDRAGSDQRGSWNQNWIEVAARLCRVDDGLPRRMDRNPQLKALGNAIVPQVAEEIMKAIKSTL